MTTRMKAGQALALANYIEGRFREDYPDLRIYHRTKGEQAAAGAFMIASDGARCMMIDRRGLEGRLP